MKYIYPEVLYTRTRIETTVRKKHTDGKWYLNTIIESVRPNASSQDWDTALERFNSSFYIFLIAGKINPDIEDDLGQPVNPLDEDQREETERLKAVILFNT